MTPFKERMNLYRAYRELNPDKNYWDWKLSLEVPAMRGGGNTEDARFTPIDTPIIPKSHDQYYTDWQSNWLNRRREQLHNNLDDMRYSTSGWISLKEQNNDIRDNKWNYDHNLGDYSILPLLKGESPDRVWINKEYYKQLNNAAIAPDTILNASFGSVNGAYVPLDMWDATGHYIVYPEDASLSTKIHERTHASNPRPQEEKILNITGHKKSKKSAGVDYESYIRDPREVYARLMQFRHDLHIDPSKVFKAGDLNTYRKELEKYNLHIFSDDQLLRILNEVASNDVKLEPFAYSAKNGGVIPAMSTGGNTLNWHEKLRSKLSTAAMNAGWIYSGLGYYGMNIFHPTNVAQDSYLVDRKLLQKMFEREGYTKVGKDYGLVKKAVGNRNLPVFQKTLDAQKREKLIVLGNIDNTWYGSRDTDLDNAAHYPSALYVDKDGWLYQKAWDLNDYGEASAGNSVYRYGGVKLVLANMLDKIGSPTVVTTGFQPIHSDRFDGTHVNAFDIKTKYDRFDGERIVDVQFGFLEELDNALSKKGLSRIDLGDSYTYGLPEIIIKPTIQYDAVVPAMQHGGENKLLQDPARPYVDEYGIVHRNRYANGTPYEQGLELDPVADVFNPMNDVYDVVQIGKDATEGNWAGVGTGLVIAAMPKWMEKAGGAVKSGVKKLINKARNSDNVDWDEVVSGLAVPVKKDPTGVDAKPISDEIKVDDAHVAGLSGETAPRYVDYGNLEYRDHIGYTRPQWLKDVLEFYNTDVAAREANIATKLGMVYDRPYDRSGMTLYSAHPTNVRLYLDDVDFAGYVHNDGIVIAKNSKFSPFLVMAHESGHIDQIDAYNSGVNYLGVWHDNEIDPIIPLTRSQFVADNGHPILTTEYIPEVKNVLDDAYQFTEEYLEKHPGIARSLEAGSTNRENRADLWLAASKPSPAELNNIIDNMTDDDVLYLLSQGNGYSRDFYRSIKLRVENGANLHELVGKVKYAMKYIPAFAAPMALAVSQMTNETKDKSN